MTFLLEPKLLDILYEQELMDTITQYTAEEYIIRHDKSEIITKEKL